jgi:hypothetical protein
MTAVLVVAIFYFLWERKFFYLWEPNGDVRAHQPLQQPAQQFERVFDYEFQGQ